MILNRSITVLLGLLVATRTVPLAAEDALRQHDRQQLGRLQWRLGVVARDKEHDPIKAAHYFYRAAQSARQAGDEESARDFLLAAQYSSDSVEHTFVHDDRINHAVFSPDEKFVLTVSHDRTARLWDAANGKLVRTFPHGGAVFHAVFSPDGQKILTWGRPERQKFETHALLWDIHKEEPILDFGGRFGRIQNATFTADSARCFIWNREDKTWEIDRKGRLWVWAIDRNEVVFELPDYVETPRADGGAGLPALHIRARVPSVGGRKDFDAWRADIRQKKMLVRELSRSAIGAAFSSDGSRLVTWKHYNRSVQLWNAENKKLLHTFTLPRAVEEAAFSPDDRTILIRTGDSGVARSSDFTSSVTIWRPDGQSTPFFRQSPSEFEGATFSPDGERVLTWSEDGTARLWNVTPQALMQSFHHDQEIRNAVLNPDATRLFTRAGRDVRMWNTADGALLKTFRHQEEFAGSLQGPLLSPDGQWFLTWNSNHTLDDEVVLTTKHGYVWLWDAEQQRSLRRLRHAGWITATAWSSDGSQVISAAEDRKIRLWDVRHDKLLRSFQLDKTYPSSLRFTAGETMVLVLESDKPPGLGNHGTGVSVWETDNEARPVGRFLHPSLVDAVLNADNSQLLTWSAYEVRLWEVGSGKMLNSFKVSSDDVAKVASSVHTAFFDKGEPRIVTRHIPRRIPNNDAPLSIGEYQQERIWEFDNPEPIGSQRIMESTHKQRVSTNGRHALRENRGVVEYYSIDHREPLIRCASPSPLSDLLYQSGFRFSPDEARMFLWGHDARGGMPVAQIWDLTLRDHRPIGEQLRNHEIRTGTRLDEFGEVRPLGFGLRQKLWDEREMSE